jgi:TolA-binding protein
MEARPERMKRAERQHLKENELQSLARQVRERYDARKREMTAVVAVLVVLGAIGIGYIAWRESVQARANALLAQAEAVHEARIAAAPAPGQADPGGPRFGSEAERAQAALAKFKAAADAYPSADAGIFARYQQAVTAMTLGDTAGATRAYQQVIDANGDGFYGQMARLGLAEAQARAGQYDQAIRAFQDLAQRKDGRLPIDGILMQLGRTYRDAGKRAEAQQTFNRLVEEFPESPFSGDARRELDNLKKT